MALKSFESALKDLRESVKAETTLDKPVALLQEVSEKVKEGKGADLETLDVVPTTNAQTITPTGNVDGYDQVNVSAVTAAIDQNISAENIKKDVEILGVTGSYEGASDSFVFKCTSSRNGHAGTETMLDLEIANGVTVIDNFGSAYALQSIELPNTVIQISDSAFSNCYNLTNITFPASVTYIGDGAFSDCNSLETIDLTAFVDSSQIPTLEINNFILSEGETRPANFKILFANQTMLDAFAAATNWSDYSQYFEVAQV